MFNCAWPELGEGKERKEKEILLLLAWAHVTGASLPPCKRFKELSSWVCCCWDPELQTPLLPDLVVQWPSTVFLFLSLNKFLLLRQHLLHCDSGAYYSSLGLCWRCSWLPTVPEMERKHPLPQPILDFLCLLWWSSSNADDSLLLFQKDTLQRLIRITPCFTSSPEWQSY